MLHVTIVCVALGRLNAVTANKNIFEDGTSVRRVFHHSHSVDGALSPVDTIPAHRHNTLNAFIQAFMCNAERGD